MNPLATTGLTSLQRPTALSVNVNKVALLRNQRDLAIPSVTHIAGLALDAGAHGITVHPRPDERHIRASDLPELAALCAGRRGVEFNIEGNPFHNLMPLVRAFRPDQCTFVPDAADQSTSDHGWDLARDAERLRPVIDEARTLGVRVSLFVDAVPEAMAAARALGADRVELYTEPYASAFGTARQAEVLARFAAAARTAAAVGLGVNAGHDLNHHNLAAFVGALPALLEVSIGHALIARALELGIDGAVREYLRCIAEAVPA